MSANISIDLSGLVDAQIGPASEFRSAINSNKNTLKDQLIGASGVTGLVPQINNALNGIHPVSVGSSQPQSPNPGDIWFQTL